MMLVTYPWERLFLYAGVEVSRAQNARANHLQKELQIPCKGEG